MIDKFVISLISPLGSALVGLFLALLLRNGRFKSLAFYLGLFSLFWLYVWSTPFASARLSYAVEQRYPAMAVDKFPVADVVIILGGGVASSGTPQLTGQRIDLGEAADRVRFGARLFHAGKVQKLIVAGGFAGKKGNRLSEAQVMAIFLHDLGVPASVVVLEDTSKNTRENSANTLALITTNGWQKVLVVTSAVHMPRALGHYEQEGVEFIAAATDYRSSGLFSQHCCFPNAGALAESSSVFKELSGQLVF